MESNLKIFTKLAFLGRVQTNELRELVTKKCKNVKKKLKLLERIVFLSQTYKEGTLILFLIKKSNLGFSRNKTKDIFEYLYTI